MCILVYILSENLCTNSFHLASYFNELSLLNKQSSNFPYSIVAASSLILSQFVLENDVLCAMCLMPAKESSTVLVYDKLNGELTMELFLLSNFLSFTISSTQST